jgi:regulator of RNase E activity RraA
MRITALLTSLLAATALGFAGTKALPAAEDPLVEGFRLTEVASVADAIEQLYGRQAYMHHDMRAVFKTKFAGPAVTVLLKKEEHKEGTAATQGMIQAIDTSPAGSVYVLVLEDGLDYGAVGGLMATTMKVRGFAGAVVDASVRDLPQIQRIQFPVYSRGVSPGTTVGHYRSVGLNIPVTCAGVTVRPKDIITADEDGVVVVPFEKAAEVLKKAQDLDHTEHSMYPFIERFKSLSEAIARFGRL